MVKLFCALVGVAGSAFPVDIDATQTVGDLKKAIREENKKTITGDARELQLFLAKKDHGWLLDDDPAALQLEEGGIHEDIQALIDGEQMKATWGIQESLNDKNMPEPQTRQIHVLVVIRTEGEDEDKGDSEPALKRARHDHRDFAIAATDLMGKIRDCNCDAIFDIETVLELPFPSLSTAPNRFHCNENDVFWYQARSELKPLHDKVKAFWFKAKPITVNVAGTIGYGKSHMLAVLVLLLLKNPIENRYGSMPFVCYIPDCRKLLAGEPAVVTILQQNILLNMPDFAGPLNTIEDIRAAMRGRRVILVADQWNSIDEEDIKCQAAIDQLNSCLGTSLVVEIHGMSMNAKTWRKLLPKQTSDDNNKYYGGFDDDEFGVWLQYHPAIFTEHEDELALLTGKVPILLSVFARVYGNGDSWENVVQRVQQDTIVEDWVVLLMKFYDNIDEGLVWKVLTLSVDWLAESTIVDFRFFYQDRKRGFCATSEIVLRLLYRVWSKKSADKAILSNWSSLVDKARNRSTLGFDVEEIIKAQICSVGVVGKYPKPSDWTIKRYRFNPGSEQSTLDVAMEERRAKSWWILLDPQIFNYPGVDMILVTETMFVGINVTIANTHRPMDPFFNLWRPLAESKKMAITGLFVAPDNFAHKEENVDTVLFRNVYHELWRTIESKIK